jgi:hypothetical protein
MALAALAGLTTSAADSLCASVKIEIRQELTLERQAFEAKMRISNGLTGVALTDVAVALSFEDEDRRPVTFTVGDANATNALFFAQNPTLNGFDAAAPNTVAGGTDADIGWLIIPNPGAAGENPDGTLYYVGATLTYKVQGVPQTVTVSPDYIFVKPMPYLALDYFLPGQVYGDDAFTPEIEPPIPFPLGLRIRNVGHGVANGVRIDSGQPEIVTNGINLLVGFKLTEGSVDGAAVSPSLLLDFGSIKSAASKMGYWKMEVTLSGTFTNFNAEISHSDALGGQVTSLINPTNVHAHLHLKDVRVDLPGRDGIVDFLGADMRVYESEGMDSAVANVGCTVEQTGADTYRMTLNAGSNGFVYSTVTDPQYSSDVRVLKSAVRSDGKVMSLSNVWLSKRREGTGSGWLYSLNLFDTEGSGFSYTLTFDDVANVNRAPVFQYMPNKTVAAGKSITFLAVASDDGGAPQLSASALPSGATFTPGQSSGNLARGVFSWTPATAQGGVYPVKFTASDGVLSDSETVLVTVAGGSAASSDTEGPGWWKNRAVLYASPRTNDFAALNMGQLKHLAHMAWNELNTLPGGAGFLLVVTNAANNYAAVNVGQLKEVATPFYNRMGITNSYPWSETVSSNDFAIANVGQAKYVFSFDPYKDSDADGMPDWWEDLYGLNKTNAADADGDKDGDGVSNLQEFLNATSP